MNRDKLVEWMDSYLESNKYSDYCPNGLQCEGKENVQKVILGVSASVELLERAVEQNADMVLVHHGMIWKGDKGTITGSYKKKIELLLKNQLNLVGYHLPLDGHLEVGNAKALADKLGIEITDGFCNVNGGFIGAQGKLMVSRNKFIDAILQLNPNAYIFDHAKSINSVAIVTGGAPGEFRKAIAEGFDCYITGEVSEWVFHTAKEEQKTFIGAGHHATETFGIQALGKKIQEMFEIQCEFINIENPV